MFHITGSSGDLKGGRLEKGAPGPKGEQGVKGQSDVLLFASLVFILSNHSMYWVCLNVSYFL